jgi:hypothetical protein
MRVACLSPVSALAQVFVEVLDGLYGLAILDVDVCVVLGTEVPVVGHLQNLHTKKTAKMMQVSCLRCK